MKGLAYGLISSCVVACAVFVGVASAGAQEPERVYTPGEGVSRPKLVADVRPAYTAAAMRERIEGEIVLEAVVGVDGRTSAVRVITSLDAEHGLDDEAVKALEQWRFEPGQKDGKAVPVKIACQMTFTLRK